MFWGYVGELYPGSYTLTGPLVRGTQEVGFAQIRKSKEPKNGLRNLI